MCGIAGAFHPTKAVRINVKGMTNALAHRGPDAIKTEKIVKNETVIAKLGVSRLSIIAPHNGQQPIMGPNYSVCLNGEIYNHTTLRREALANGVTPINDSDAAVVAALCEFLPVQLVLKRLRGMFALSIVKKDTGDLWLVRDRMGQKPLYWGKANDGSILWSSELRGLTRQPGLNRGQNKDAIATYFMLEYIPAPHTPYLGIHKLQAGHLLKANADGISVKRWWEPPQISDSVDRDLNPWRKAFSFALTDAVRLRARADTPIAAVISGGLDSSAIACLAMESGHLEDAFTAAVKSEGFDESAQATQVAKALGLNLATTNVDLIVLNECRQAIAKHFDEPLADSSTLPTWALFQSVNQAGYKCVLSGDGADESLAGYPTYLAHQLRPFASVGRGLLSSLVNRLPVSEAGVSFDYMAKRFAAALNGPWWKDHMLWMGAWTPNEIIDNESIWNHIEGIAEQAGQGAIGQAMFLDQRLYLSECVLTKVDRCSMAFGVEVRSPFLDHRLVELMATLPINAKLHRGRSKVILKQFMADKLPKSIIHRRKKGFGSPVSQLLRQLDNNEIDRIQHDCSPWIKPETFDRIWSAHQKGEANHRRRLWTALTFSDWLSNQNQIAAK